MYPSFVAQLLLIVRFTFLVTSICHTGFTNQMYAQSNTSNFPWKKAGYTEREAIAHLLDRLTFGARQEDITKVQEMGIERWVEQQLNQIQAEDKVDSCLKDYKTLAMSTREIAQVYPTPGKVIIELMQSGALKDLPNNLDTNSKEYAKTVLTYAYKQGYRPLKELLGEMVANKILRATYSPNQLREVLTDFWFNHFTVSATKGQARPYIMSYERDAIRPNVLGKFEQLLLSTAKHPAMLQYLDNAQSTAPEGVPTLKTKTFDSLKNLGGFRGMIAKKKIETFEEKAEEMKAEYSKNIPKEFVPRRGLNENYARELLELHTLGVNGGYTQKDVTEVARLLTGWSMMPLGFGKRTERVESLIEKGKKIGTVVEGDFVFRADQHDIQPKTALGTLYPYGGGYDEALDIFNVVSHHPSTAKHIAHKLCVRFVCDSPSVQLVNAVSQVFMRSEGDIKEVMKAIISSDDFWKKEYRTAKIKSPFELVIGAFRVLNAEVKPTKQLYDIMQSMGQPMYSAQAPTGFGDISQTWVNSGTLLYRMNFGIALATNVLKGVSFDIAKLTNNHEPASMSDALSQYLKILLPERDIQQTYKTLLPIISSPEYINSLQKKIMGLPNTDKSKPIVSSKVDDDEMMTSDEFDMMMGDESTASSTKETQTSIATVLGIILGSPEFQRR
jgi:uncharacterized protein (DUF1800 family)